MAYRLYVFLSLCLWVFASRTGAFFDIEELQNARYGLEILNEPVLWKELDLGNVMHVASVHGQKYQCDLPAVHEGEKIEDELHEDASGNNVTEVLKDLNKKCIHYTKDWWTYELCFNQHISQYHEEDFQAVGEKIYLGYQVPSTKDQQPESEESKKSKRKKKKYHVEFYSNGTLCDLIGQPRKAEVRFQCDKDALSERVVSISESETCSYLIIVSTSLLCKIPAYTAPDPPTPKSITCSPALSQEQFNLYIASKEPQSKKVEQVEDEIEMADGLGKGEETDIYGNFGGDHLTMTTSVRSNQKESSYISMIGRRLFSNMNKQIKKYEAYLDKDSSKETKAEMEKKKMTQTSEEVQQDRDLTEELTRAFEQVTAKRMKMELLLKNKLKTIGVDKAELDRILNGDSDDNEEEEDISEDDLDEEGDVHSGKQLLKMINKKNSILRKTLHDKVKTLIATTLRMEEDEVLEQESKERKLADEIRRLLNDEEYQVMLIWKKEEELKIELVKSFTTAKKHVPEKNILLDRDERSENSRLRRTQVLESLKEIISVFDKVNSEMEAEIRAVRTINEEIQTQLDKISEMLDDLPDPKKTRAAMEKCKATIYHFTETQFNRYDELDSAIEQVQKRRNQNRIKWLDQVFGQDFKERTKEAKKSVLGKFTDGTSHDEIEQDEGDSQQNFGEYNVDRIVSRVKKMLSALSGTENKKESKKDKDKKVKTALKDTDENTDVAATKDNRKESKNTISVEIKKIKNVKGNQGWYGDSNKNMEHGDEDEEGLKSATKQMENMIKQQLKDAGVVPSADIKVKIYTSRDSLSNVVDDPGGAQLLSEDETMQFKDLLMGLLGGGKASLVEKERQEKLQNNYNLVWGANGFQKVQTEDNNDEENKAELIYRGV